MSTTCESIEADVGTGVSAVEVRLAQVLRANAFDWRDAPSGRWRGLAYMREKSRIRRLWEARWPAASHAFPVIRNDKRRGNSESLPSTRPG